MSEANGTEAPSPPSEAPPKPSDIVVKAPEEPAPSEYIPVGERTVAPGPNAIDPIVRVHQIIDAIRPPRRPRTARDLTISDHDTGYQVIRWRPGISSGSFQKSKRFTVSGDHLYVEQINGQLPVYVKMGPTTNPFIRLRRGMTLNRRFSQIILLIADPLATPLFATDVTLYASFGRLVEQFELPGVDASLFAAGANGSIVIGTSPSIISQVLNGDTCGSHSGTLAIRNDSPGTDIFLGGAGNSLSSPDGFRIKAGEIMTLQLAGRISCTDISGGIAGLFLFTLAGTAPVSLMLSPVERDTFDQSLGTDAGGIAG